MGSSISTEMENLLLVGFMGAGKSTVGRKLAQLTGWEFVDLDALVEREALCTIKEIFKNHGEKTFRKKESAALASLVDQKNKIIATGGGIVGSAENWTLMKRIGPIVYLQVCWGTILERLSGCDDRPLFNMQEINRVRQLFESRLPLYEKADKIVVSDGKLPEAVSMEIYEWLTKEFPRV